MRFRCESCGAQYAIADEKLGRKGVRVRCKKCGEIIAVRPGGDEDEDEAERRPRTNSSANAPDDQLNLGEDEDLKNAFDGLLNRGKADPGDADDADRESTRVFNVEGMQKIQQEREQTHGDAKEPSTTEGFEEERRAEWYIAVEDEQIGPISRSELLQRIGAREFDKEMLVWRNGFEDWLPILEVPELSSALTEPRDRDGYGSGSSEDEAESPIGGGSWSPEHQGEMSDESQDDASPAERPGPATDWKPSALSSLNRLAEEELQSLRPEDPVSEESDSSQDVGSGGAALDEGMTDGESSLLSQIAEEEVSAARRIEEDRQTAEREVEEQKRREEEQALAAQEAAAREKQAEERKKAAVVEEQRIMPPKAGMPRWVIGLISTSALLLMAMSIAVLFFLFRSSKEDPQKPHAAGQLLQPAAPASSTPTPNQPALASAPTNPTKEPTGSATAPPTPATEAAPRPQAAVVASAPEPAGKKVALAEEDRLGRKKPKVEAKAAPLRPERVERSEPEPKPEPPVKKKSGKGGILDFEEDDSQAYAASVGLKPVEKAKEAAPKKDVPELSNAAVLDVMKEHLEEFKACNRRQKERDASVNGKMVISFVVNTDGKVGQAGLSTKTPQFKGTFVAECISGIVRRLKFPECAKQKPVDFPFTVN